MSQHDATIYRQRAAHLRRLSDRLSSSASMQLQRFATVDTWFGPRPDACAGELARAQSGVRAAADDLRRQAVIFERRAEQLDAEAAAAELAGRA